MKEKIAVAPYTALAPIYDAVMQHVDYVNWARYVHALVEQYHPGARRLVDLSCGTGSCCFQLAKLGYQVLGMDFSHAMVRRAKSKLDGSMFAFFCADMCFPPLRHPVEVMISLYDSINYLQQNQWPVCLRHIQDALEIGGLFIFDVGTLFNSSHEFSDYHEQRAVKGGRYRRTCSFDAVGGLQTNYFEITLTDRPEATFCEAHRQTIRSLTEVDELVAQSPLRKIAAFKDFTLEPATEQCERVHYILRRES